jgi:hypothetical protein
MRLTESEKNKIESFNTKLMEYDGKDFQLMLNDILWKTIVNEANGIVKILEKYTW